MFLCYHNPNKETVRIRVKRECLRIQRQPFVLQQWIEELTFLWQAMEMTGPALASEPGGASLNPNNMKSNRTQLKIERHRKKHHKHLSNYYIMARHPIYPGAQKTQQRGLHGLVIAGIGFRQAHPLLSLPTPFPTC